jgi:uncharacterized membrane protein YsdA (DUF1294 family)
MRLHLHPVLRHSLLALALTLLLATASWYAVSREWRWLPWAIAWFLSVNVVALAYYGIDKYQAQRAGRRVPEVVLFQLAILGGSPGAYTAMRLFRHKTVKGSFRALFWLIVLIQTGVLAWLAYRQLAERFDWLPAV